MSNGTLPGVLGALAPVLNQYGYLAVGGFILVEDFGVPAPGETILIAAAVYAGAGKLNIVLVVLVAFVAAVLGDNIGYAIGNFLGRRLVLRWGKYVFITESRLDAAESFFQRHGGKVVVVARFIEGLRQLNGIIAGISDMRWRQFLTFNAIGAAVWVAAWSALGYFAGNHITKAYAEAKQYSLYLLIGVAVLVALLVLRAVVRRRRRAPAEERESRSVSS
jgi:membrane protein DedA with SNARE-associated domain